MPISLGLEICPIIKALKIEELAGDIRQLIAWWYTGITKNFRDNHQPLVTVAFRELVGKDQISNKVILKKIPLTAIGQVRLGSIWKDGRCISMYQFEEDEFEVDFSTVGWEFTSFFSTSQTNQPPYPFNIYPLDYPKDKVQLIKFILRNGGQLLIPCLEFFSRCYGRSQELNRILATYPWVGHDNPNASRLYAPLDEPEEQGKWKIKLRKRLLNGDTTFLAHAKYDQYTQRQAKSIYAQIEAEYMENKSHFVFLKVAPWFQGEARIKVRGIRFSNNKHSSFLALQILGCSDPNGILIKRYREIDDISISSGHQNNSTAIRPAETELIYPPDIINLTGNLPPDNDAHSVEVLDNDFHILGVPRSIEDATGKRIKDPSKVIIQAGDNITPFIYSCGESSSSNKGVGQAFIHARPVIESHGWLNDMWDAALNLEKVYPKRVKDVSWLTFDDGYQKSEPPNLVSFVKFETDEGRSLDIAVRNWPYLNTSTFALRGALVIHLIVDGKLIHIVELQRRPVNKTAVIDGKSVKRPSEQNFQGLIVNSDSTYKFEKMLRQFLCDIRYEKGVVQKLITRIENGHSFSHVPTNGHSLRGHTAILNALAKCNIIL